MRLLLLSALALFTVASISAEPKTPPTPGALVTSNPKFQVLIELLKFTGLLQTLVNDPGITIFAPTNFAFGKSIKGLGCGDPKDVRGIVSCIKHLFGRVYVEKVLLYHVTLGVLDSEAVLEKETFDTFSGQRFKRDGLTLIDNIDNSTNPNLISSMLNLSYGNSIVHGINRVLLPVPNNAPGIVQVAEEANVFNILGILFSKTGLAEDVIEASYITIFAPTDKAFKRSSSEVGCKMNKRDSAEDLADCLIKYLSKDYVKMVLAYHIVPGLFSSARVLEYTTYHSTLGVPFFRKKLTLVDQAPAIANPRLVKSLVDLKFDNGIIHGISRVLLPFNTEGGSACQQYESPLSIADYSFIKTATLAKKARKCKAVKRAISKCSLRKRDVCKVGKALKKVYSHVTLGDVIAAAKKCKPVAAAVKACKQ